MGVEVASAYVTLMPSMRGFERSLNRQMGGAGAAGAAQFSQGFKGKIKAFAQKAFIPLTAAAAGAGALIKGAITEASDLQQSVGATETVFGKAADYIAKKSKHASTQYGLSANEYRENANLIGSLFKNQGVATDKLGKKTDQMIGQASDLAATFGGTTKEAVEALGSAFKGEFDPLERYGISLKQSTVNTEAYRLAGVKTQSAFNKLSTAQQTAYKQQATNNLIMKQSKDATGAFGRETDTLAHQQQVLGAQFKDVQATVGSALLPALTGLGKAFSSKALPAVKKFIGQMRSGKGAGGKFADGLARVKDTATSVIHAVTPLFKAIGGAAKALWTNAQPLVSLIGSGLKLAFRAIAPVLPLIVKGMTGFFNLVKKLAPVIVPLVVGIGAYKAIMATTRVVSLGLTAATYGQQGAMLVSGAAAKVYAARMLFTRDATGKLTIATKAQAIAQRGLNLVMNMNPLGLIIAGLIALAAAVVIAWKRSETFRKIVLAVWGAIKTAALATVNWFRNTAWPAFKNVLQWIGDKAKWLYDKVIRPVWRGIRAAISAVVGWFRDTVWPIFRKVFGFIAAKVKWLFVAYFKAYFGLIKAIIKAVAWFFRDVAWPIFRKVFTWVADKAKWLWQHGIAPAFRGIKRAISAVFNWLKNTGWGTVKRVFGWIADKAKWLWHKGIKPAFDLIRKGVGKVRDAFRAARDGIGKIWDKLQGLVKKPIRFVVDTVINKVLVGGINKLVPFGDPLSPIKLPKGFDIGGWTGPGARLQPAGIVHADEFVVKKASRRRIERQAPGLLDHMNRTGSVPGYARGGQVAGGGGGMTWPLIWDFVHRHWPGVAMTSNYRPGAMSLRRSSHALGTAIDIGGSQQQISRVMRYMASHFGRNMRDLIYSPLWGHKMISDGRWITTPGMLYRQHFNHGHIGLEPGVGLNGGPAAGVGGGGGLLGGLPGKISGLLKGVVDKFKGNPYAQIPVQLGKKAISGLWDWAKEKLNPLNWFGGEADGKGTLAKGTAAKLTTQAIMAEYGWDHGAAWRAIDNIVSRESSWNPHARNASSGAYGLFQALPPSKMAKYGPDWRNNVDTQAKFGRGYISSRYGSPQRAWRFWQRHNWYADGGRVKPTLYDRGGELPAGLSIVANKTGSPERVVTASQWADIVDGRSEGPTVNVYGVRMDVAGEVADEVLGAIRRTSRGKYRRV